MVDRAKEQKTSSLNKKNKMAAASDPLFSKRNPFPLLCTILPGI